MINGDTLLEVKCPFPIPTQWKYDVVKIEQNCFKLKVNGSRGYYLQIMFCADLRKCKLLIRRCKDDYIRVDVQYNAECVHEQIQRLRTFYAMKMMHRMVDEIENERLVFSRLFKHFLHLRNSCS